ncbi:hypothetical protein Thimo_3282 [Thioflavicoccus mobilis 8321]|uniref:Cobalamin biosynthesis protein CbiX n=1 Tax=Thioflavicoccus mobilis 8321 TaxID=765912 RepID=L0H2T0_9GAMM|nr:hypothetical protein [Thioflavicoccus mobilis]AGA91960.1 hypothetical protein Thimo_3282 [Thioflavicoccus mobilis 8321]
MTTDADLAKPTILLLDNGSLRADATRGLRHLATELARRTGEPIHPVSLLHSDRIRPEELDGIAAETLDPFLRRHLEAGGRRFVVLPLFFGPSSTLTRLVPHRVAALTEVFGPVTVETAQPLCPLPAGEARLAAILHDNLTRTAARAGEPLRRVILVDHGSPLPEVTAVRRWLANTLRARLGSAVTVEEAVMERRPEQAYDFNGELLEQRLERLARRDPTTPVFLSLLFIGPGRHAGAGGDIDTIRHGVARHHRGFRTLRTELVGAHPDLVEILSDRLHDALHRVRAPTIGSAPGRL